MAVTPGEVAVTGGANGTRSLPSRVVPPHQLPSTPDELAAEAAARLGWHGVVLPEIRLLGRKVNLVARLRTVAHAERIAMGVAPVTDRAVVDTWTWPEFVGSAPAAAVEIAGVLTVQRHWRTGLAALVPFARYGETAMVLPSAATLTEDYVDNCLPRARTYGMAVLTADEDAVVETDLLGHSERLLVTGDPISRWVNEVAYELLLAHELPAAVD
ncbi:hypothetical protein [Amycolatopsis albispora]|uniref:Uncharacterized protein n=1 Tax=Amycolatopsis albispora TaxID=1804986 RepID=A0A344LD88_9PSEU|nr:hypothetical protein [Amycolatopsis albispora]AXB46012.1 hypothetical protein A4R43_28965 [Amycolatopsis albispora]